MQVILLEDIKTLGKKGDIVKVSDGYATNFVLPKKLGIEATPKNLNDLKVQQKRDEKAAAEILAQSREYAEKVEAVTVKVCMKAGEGVKVFCSVS